MFKKFKEMKELIKGQVEIIRNIPGQIDAALSTANDLAATIKEAATVIDDGYKKLSQTFEAKSPVNPPATDQNSADIIIEAEFTEIRHQPELSYK